MSSSNKTHQYLDKEIIRSHFQPDHSVTLHFKYRRSWLPWSSGSLNKLQVTIASSMYYDATFNRLFWTPVLKTTMQSLRVRWEYIYDREQLVLRTDEGWHMERAVDVLRAHAQTALDAYSKKMANPRTQGEQQTAMLSEQDMRSGRDRSGSPRPEQPARRSSGEKSREPKSERRSSSQQKSEREDTSTMPAQVQSQPPSQSQGKMSGMDPASLLVVERPFAKRSRPRSMSLSNISASSLASSNGSLFPPTPLSKDSLYSPSQQQLHYSPPHQPHQLRQHPSPLAMSSPQLQQQNAYSPLAQSPWLMPQQPSSDLHQFLFPEDSQELSQQDQQQSQQEHQLQQQWIQSLNLKQSEEGHLLTTDEREGSAPVDLEWVKVQNERRRRSSSISSVRSMSNRQQQLSSSPSARDVSPPTAAVAQPATTSAAWSPSDFMRVRERTPELLQRQLPSAAQQTPLEHLQRIEHQQPQQPSIQVHLSTTPPQASTSSYRTAQPASPLLREEEWLQFSHHFQPANQRERRMSLPSVSSPQAAQTMNQVPPSITIPALASTQQHHQSLLNASSPASYMSRPSAGASSVETPPSSHPISSLTAASSYRQPVATVQPQAPPPPKASTTTSMGERNLLAFVKDRSDRNDSVSFVHGKVVSSTFKQQKERAPAQQVRPEESTSRQPLTPLENWNAPYQQLHSTLQQHMAAPLPHHYTFPAPGPMMMHPLSMPPQPIPSFYYPHMSQHSQRPASVIMGPSAYAPPPSILNTNQVFLGQSAPPAAMSAPTSPTHTTDNHRDSRLFHSHALANMQQEAETQLSKNHTFWKEVKQQQQQQQKRKSRKSESSKRTTILAATAPPMNPNGMATPSAPRRTRDHRRSASVQNSPLRNNR